jgi:hypothetical protein
MVIWKIFKLSSLIARGLEGFRSGAGIVQQGFMVDPNKVYRVSGIVRELAMIRGRPKVKISLFFRGRMHS